MLAQLIAECSDYDFKREVEISKPKVGLSPSRPSQMGWAVLCILA